MRLTMQCLLNKRALKSHKEHPGDTVAQMKFAAEFTRLLASTSLIWSQTLQVKKKRASSEELVTSTGMGCAVELISAHRRDRVHITSAYRDHIGAGAVHS